MKRKSIYKYSAEAGVPAGLYLTVMSACVLMSIKVPFLPLLIMPLAIGFPFLLWKLVKNICKAEPSYQKFSPAWLGGIYTVIFGTLICMLFSALYIQFVEPNFVGIYINNAIQTLQSSPMSAEYEASIALIKEAMEAHALPSSMEFITTMGWFTCFSGCIMSLVIALILSKAGRKVTTGEYI